jgi:hypothetical protein
MKFRARTLSMVLSVLCVAAAYAQQPADVTFFNPMHIEFMSGPIAFDSEPVTGAPYSADAVTEVVQTLADGNRIVRESKAQVSRDGKGRTRREEGLSMFGPVIGGPNGTAELRHVQISDPTSKTTIMLDLQNKIAHKVPAPTFTFNDKPIGAGARVEQFQIALPPPPPGAPAGGVHVFRREGIAAGDAAAKPVAEKLGTQLIEGVEAEGTRTTLTIPAGQIGNELPITVVSERWFSPELKVLVMSRQSDPRYGETTYRLTNLTRGEPSPDLFEVPADFKVVEPNMKHDVVIERKIVK